MAVEIPPAIMPGGELYDLIVAKAAEHGLDPCLVAAIVWEESRGITTATSHRLDTPGLDLNRVSWGLMQVQGGTARGLGYRGRLYDLLAPAIGLEWGCRALRHYLDRRGPDAGLRAYHAGIRGANRDYAHAYAVRVCSREKLIGLVFPVAVRIGSERVSAKRGDTP